MLQSLLRSRAVLPPPPPLLRPPFTALSPLPLLPLATAPLEETTLLLLLPLFAELLLRGSFACRGLSLPPRTCQQPANSRGCSARASSEAQAANSGTVVAAASRERQLPPAPAEAWFEASSSAAAFAREGDEAADNPRGEVVAPAPALDPGDDTRAEEEDEFSENAAKAPAAAPTEADGTKSSQPYPNKPAQRSSNAAKSDAAGNKAVLVACCCSSFAHRSGLALAAWHACAGNPPKSPVARYPT